jgi:hypothetical protein
VEKSMRNTTKASCRSWSVHAPKHPLLLSYGSGARGAYIDRLLREDAAGLDKFGLIAVPLVAQKRHNPAQLRAVTPPASLMTMREENRVARAVMLPG